MCNETTETNKPCPTSLIVGIAGILAVAVGVMLIVLSARPGGNWRATATVEGLSADNAIAGKTGVALDVTSVTVDTGGNFSSQSLSVGYEFTATADTYISGELEGAYTVCALTGNTDSGDACSTVTPDIGSTWDLTESVPNSMYAKKGSVIDSGTTSFRITGKPGNVQLALINEQGATVASRTVHLDYEEYGTTYGDGESAWGIILADIGVIAGIIGIANYVQKLIRARREQRRAHEDKERIQQRAAEHVK